MDIVALCPEDEGTFEQSVDPKTVDAPMDGTRPAVQINNAEDMWLEQFILVSMLYNNWNDTGTLTHGFTGYMGDYDAMINVETSHEAKGPATFSDVLGNGWIAAPPSGLIIPEQKDRVYSSLLEWKRFLLNINPLSS